MSVKAKRYERCRVCGRLLKSDKGKKRGYGLECAKKLRRGFGGIQVEQFEDVGKLGRKLHVAQVKEMV